MTKIIGGGFLLSAVGDSRQFIPEDLSPEMEQLLQTTRDFIDGEVMTRKDEIESKVPGVVATLMRKAGALGLMMVEIPEAYNGLDLGKVAATVVAEGSSLQSSFAVSLICHTGIGTLPLLYYGSEAQKQKYLTKLATGEMLASYALTEAGSGTDALAARTRATLTPDGKYYLLNGEKQFITNGGFADLFTVFAKIDGEKFSAFLVERTFSGVSQGPEEDKLGVRGSSTVPVILEDARVPAENLLGEIGKGHKIAFHTLNVGRWKLAAASVGSCKDVLSATVKYIKERRQFGKTIAEFELTKQKIAEMAIGTFMVESMVYRYAGDLDVLNATIDKSAADACRKLGKMTEELQIEASICKVFGSETLFYLADESVQLFGGYGYIKDYRPEGFYRDNRINRIWEGTNEINRLLIPGTLLKLMAKGKINVLDAFTEIIGEIRGGFPAVESEAPLAIWQDQVNQLKRLAVYVGGVGVNTYGPAIQERQQFLTEMADLMIAAYVADSALSRVLILQARDAARAVIPALMVQCWLTKIIPQLKSRALQALTDVAGGDQEEARPYQKAVARFCPLVSLDLCNARVRIADTILAKDGYGW